ncbi:hypothetical protein FOMPIDRAFT_1030883 [Fomitopsis schrenkii]|uniref:AB hydrolase-1 domain-containing protein n=1 Tax=Fomitopsis schrenkii TaxID=2126942 RepID=S8E876_FOMSC|nr:hypothetical protein FOMPIDRAFT_1030883 [Fomitopsis schrenkii]
MAAKRYLPSDSSPEGVTLLLAHGAGFHKEHWEPLLERLCAVQSTKEPTGRIREAWAFDWQGHGDSAVLNEAALKRRGWGVSNATWARGIHAFLDTPHVQGHRLVMIGHSSGATAAMYSTKLFSNIPPYVAIILVEPPLIDRRTFAKHLKRQQRALAAVKKALAASRDTWPSRANAYTWLQSRPPYSTWDERVLRLHCEYGLRPVSADNPQGAVTTKCTKAEEVKSLDDVEVTFEATEQLEHVCDTIPIHVIFGAVVDFVPDYGQDDVVDGSRGRRMASVTRIPGAGHLVIEQKPDAVAEGISRILDSLASGCHARL